MIYPTPMHAEILPYLLLGTFTGVASGLLGIGGGIVLIPAFLAMFHWAGFYPTVTMHLAAGSSLAVMTFTALASSHAHHQHNGVAWPVFKTLVPGILIGAPLGALTAAVMHGTWLKTLFGLFMIGTALHMLIGSALQKRDRPLVPSFEKGGLGGIYVVAGAVIGFLSALLGVGGGLFTVPFLVWKKIPAATAIGTSLACVLPIGVTGSLGYLVMGWHQPLLPPHSMGYIFLPAVGWTALSSIFGAKLGALLAHKLPANKLKTAFAVLLVMVGTTMALCP